MKGKINEQQLRKIIRESYRRLMCEVYRPDMTVELIGGKYAGTYTAEQLESMFNITRYDTSGREKLDGYPILSAYGYLGPMWNGDRIRYETQEIYDTLST